MKYLLGILCLLITVEATALDWGDDSSFTKDLKSMINRVKNKFNDINDNPSFKKTLEEAADQVKVTIKDNRPSGDFVTGCAGECSAFRSEMQDFLRDMENTINTLMTFGEPVQQDLVNFNAARKAIGVAPGPVLFPLFKAFNTGGLFSGITTRLGKLPDSLEQVRESYSNKPETCEIINDNRDRFKKAAIEVSVTGLALKLVGKGLLAKGETNMMAKKKVAIHGYAGVIVEDNKKKKIGNLLDGVSDALTSSSAYLNRTIFQCEVLAKLTDHDTEIEKQITKHDEEVKILLEEAIRLLLTPQGLRRSELRGSFPLNPNRPDASYPPSQTPAESAIQYNEGNELDSSGDSAQSRVDNTLLSTTASTGEAAESSSGGGSLSLFGIIALMFWRTAFRYRFISG